LDVFEYEPPKSEVEKKLLSLDKIIATPHIGAQTKEAMEEEGKEVARIIIEFFKKIKI
jgi:D-3-phosphoglycerate dehydrogenase